MTKTQLEALVGCILKYKLKEIIILETLEDTLVIKETAGTAELRSVQDKIITKHSFITLILPKFKIYLTEDENSLVSIEQYLEHYDLK